MEENNSIEDQHFNGEEKQNKSFEQDNTMKQVSDGEHFFEICDISTNLFEEDKQKNLGWDKIFNFLLLIDLIQKC